MNEAKALRALADKLDEFEGLKLFPADITEPGDVVVTWTEGRDHEGYTALSSAISTLVSQHWNALRSQVLKSKEGEVQLARTACSNASSPHVESSTVSTNDFGMRKAS